jgi:hypothetical protein
MSRLLKRYLLWLLIAVLPIQGFAGAVLRTCASPSSRAEVAVEAVIHASLTEGMHTASIGATQMADNASCDEHVGHTSQKSTGDHEAKHGSCSACASCCVGAAAPPTLLSVRVPSRVPEVFPIPAVTPVVGFIPDNLERPPRHTAI